MFALREVNKESQDNAFEIRFKVLNQYEVTPILLGS
jgi:hypothetical protein